MYKVKSLEVSKKILKFTVTVGNVNTALLKNNRSRKFKKYNNKQQYNYQVDLTDMIILNPQNK